MTRDLLCTAGGAGLLAFVLLVSVESGFDKCNQVPDVDLAGGSGVGAGLSMVDVGVGGQDLVNPCDVKFLIQFYG